ncbi:hypothetical protein WH47_01889 [Habropoda laboriosa]|uniref:Uncharacterized protein n=1 Tax=Habropoda laboriosa TaxID=597456 RepID=A0A0L7QXQ7_9HYME|nr:hypothetical protein WH47_01889 [Habropoda laboriosa]
MHDADLDSLKTHVRVKRDKLESDYIKDLVNSFPQNNYDSIDENSYDEDVSFDTKREIKSDEFLVNDEQSNASPDENDQQKILNVQPFMVPAYFSDDTSARSDIISAPSDVSKANTFANKNVRFVDQTEKQGMTLQELKNDVISNRRSYENSEVQNLPEDPMLAVELVRKKRNDYAKVHGKRNLEKKTSSGIQNLIDSKGKSHDKEKRSILESQKSESHLIPSSLVAANLKAHLLRIRRKTKSNKRHEKNSKLKKEKKHAGKKHNTSNNSQRSVKDVRSKNTDRSKVSRKRKVHEAKSEGKPKIEIDSVVSKENNDNNFRRRSVKLKKSIKGTDSEIDVSSKNNEPTLHEKLKEVSENKIDDVNSKFSEKKSTQFGSDVNEVKAGSDEDTNLFVTQDEEQGVFINDEQPIPSLDDIKLRAKRDKNTQSHHGFLNKEEELRYYENVREPGSEMDQYDNQDENQPSVGNVVEGSRAVRSIEEVKQLAQKLVSKVGDKKREKQIETRAIDDLCANVSTGCDVFKEAPKIVQKCVPTANNEFGSKAKIVERKVDPSGVIDERKFAKIANKNSVEKKRSVVRRVAKTSPNTSKGIPRQSERKSRLKWGKWTDWSSCSVTCGKGRQIRWRYCLRDCTTAETEMEEKACQLPACPPGKFLGIF